MDISPVAVKQNGSTVELTVLGRRTFLTYKEAMELSKNLQSELADLRSDKDVMVKWAWISW